MIKKIIFSSAILVIALVLVITPVTAATSYSLFGDATIVPGGNPGNAAQIVSDTSLPSGYGGVSVVPSSPIAWASLTTLSTDFDVTNDGCGGGSPRIQVRVDTTEDGISDGNVHIALGPSPSFNACVPGWQNSGNLIGNADAGRFDYGQFGGSAFTTYANAPASVQSGQVVGLSVVVDGSWNTSATNGDSEQTVLVDNIVVNSDITTFEFQPTGVITNPSVEGQIVSGLFNFTATYDDGDAVDDDAVQWAIRQGTCQAGVGTVAGNVDGFSDAYSWDGMAFSSLLDTSSWTPGNFCFVFNPTDDPGQDDVRETRNFIIASPTPSPTASPFATPAECSQIAGLGSPIVGTNGADNINGTSGNDLIFALGGADRVDGKGGNDCIVAGGGADFVKGNNGNDVILGGDGADDLRGENGTDSLYGESGADLLRGGNHADTLIGGANQDAAKGEGGSDTCDAESENSCEL